jgi:L-malate glycosyltransferase
MAASVLFVIPSLDISGPAMQLCLLARRLADSPWKPHILCLQKEGELAASTRDAGVPVDILNVEDPLAWGTCLKVRRYCKKNDVDLIHTFLRGMDSAVVRGARSAGVQKIILSRREIEEEIDPKEHRQRIAAVSQSDLILCNSQAAREFACQIEEVPQEQIRVIPNGFPEEAVPARPALLTRPKVKKYLQSCQIQDGEKVLACIADFIPVKNHFRLLDAVRILLFERLLIRVIFFGDGPLFGEVEKYAGDKNLFRATVFMGRRMERLKMLAECDALVMPSLRESFPNSILEAQALGIPVAASCRGGIPEIIQHGENGWLFNPNDPEEMSETIRTVLFDREKALQGALIGQERVRSQFTASRMVESHIQVYNQLRG